MPVYPARRNTEGGKGREGQVYIGAAFNLPRQVNAAVSRDRGKGVQHSADVLAAHIPRQGVVPRRQASAHADGGCRLLPKKAALPTKCFVSRQGA